MRLLRLLDGLDEIQAQGAGNPECVGLAYDSRRVTPGKVFFALPGENTDGLEFAADAIDRGAVAIVAERKMDAVAGTEWILVPSARRALAQAASVYYDGPSKNLKIVGVTGTNGKTTVAYMVRHLLRQAGVSTGMLGTVEYDLGNRIFPATRTTPEALELQHLLAQMRDAGCKACVMEVSSHALAQCRVDGVDFDAAVFTNLTQDHLDYHGDMVSYFETKASLFEFVDRREPPGLAILNVDDEHALSLVPRLTGKPLLYGTSSRAAVRGTGLQPAADGTLFDLNLRGDISRVRLPLIGRHNIHNALAAAGVALELGLESKVIREGLESMPPVPGRLESVVAGQPFVVLVDYAHTDDALRAVLKALRDDTSGRLIVAFGCGGNRDAGKRWLMGEAAGLLADEVIITTDNPRREDPAEIARQIGSGFKSVRGEAVEIELDRARAIDEIIRRARPGDTVLIAGKGHETCQEIGETVMPFDDREHARATLAALGYGE